MNRSVLSGTRRHLVEQLLFFDEQLLLFLDTYMPMPHKDRSETEKIIQSYKEKLERVLTQDDEELTQTLRSVVLIGSKVTVQYADDPSSETFAVVFPGEIDPDRNIISFLSPIGRRLLLTTTGENRLIETPGHQLHVRVGDAAFTYIRGFPSML